MTTDHTPAEAGTGGLDTLARELRNLDATGKQVASVHLSRWARTIEEHRCSPPVAPGDTATEGGDVRDRARETVERELQQSSAGWPSGVAGEVVSALAAAGLLATAASPRGES